MSMIEDNMVTPRDPRSVQVWIESSKHGQEEKSTHMINVQLAWEKSHFEHRSSNNSNLGENVACDRKPGAKRIKKESKDEAQSWAQEELTEKPTPKPWEDKKDYQTIFRKYISIGEDGEEHYDMIDMQIEAQRPVRGIADHQEIVKHYQKVVNELGRLIGEYAVPLPLGATST